MSEYGKYGLNAPIGTAVGVPIPGDSDLDPSSQFTVEQGINAPLAVDYRPKHPFREIEIRGVQSTNLEVEYDNGSTDIIPVVITEAGTAWIYPGYFKAILARYTTATHIIPRF